MPTTFPSLTNLSLLIPDGDPENRFPLKQMKSKDGSRGEGGGFLAFHTAHAWPQAARQRRCTLPGRHALCWAHTEGLTHTTAPPLVAILCVPCAQSCLFVTPWTVSCQVPLSLGFARQEYWSGLPFPTPGDLLNPGMEPASPVPLVLQVDSLPTEPSGKRVQYYKVGANADHRRGTQGSEKGLIRPKVIQLIRDKAGN